MAQLNDTSTILQDLPVQFPASPKSQFGHFVAPTDFSPNSEKSVDYAVQLARRLGAKLTLLHVVPEPTALDYSMEGISRQEIEGWEAEAETKLTQELARVQAEYADVETMRVTALHPRDQILRAANDLSADLLVISTHGYRGWKHFLFGSDAEKIVEQAPCPVVVVR